MKGAWCYLYRAIDSTGATIDFLLSALRDAAAAKRLFRQALSDPSHPQPRVINTDKARLYGSAIAAAKDEGTLHWRCRHRPVQYLNNILEQDHRAIKRRVKAKQSFREFRAARRTIALRFYRDLPGFDVIYREHQRAHDPKEEIFDGVAFGSRKKYKSLQIADLLVGVINRRFEEMTRGVEPSLSKTKKPLDLLFKKELLTRISIFQVYY